MRQQRPSGHGAGLLAASHALATPWSLGHVQNSAIKTATLRLFATAPCCRCWARTRMWRAQHRVNVFRPWFQGALQGRMRKRFHALHPGLAARSPCAPPACSNHIEGIAAPMRAARTAPNGPLWQCVLCCVDGGNVLLHHRLQD